MSMRLQLLAQTITIVLFVGGTNAELSAQSQVVEVKVHSPALEHNLLGDTADQDVAIYLPAAYRGDVSRQSIFYTDSLTRR